MKAWRPMALGARALCPTTAYDRRPLDVVLMLHEAEIEVRAHELHVHAPADQSRYLDGILACKPFILRWPRRTRFSTVVRNYADAFL